MDPDPDQGPPGPEDLTAMLWMVACILASILGAVEFFRMMS